MIRCPACGFDSPDGAQWCEFCKEPFNKRSKPNGKPAAPAAGKSSEGGLPAEFSALDSGEKIPITPRWLGLTAWAFLAFWSLAMLGLFVAYLFRKSA